jgi:hypothetical protein
MIPGLAQAWWNDEWGYRKKITIDAAQLQQQSVKLVNEGLVLVRLHTGNFSFFADLGEKGKDLRFIGNDDKTPLKFYIEKIDPLNEMALIWVQLPKDIATADEASFWMYYGNAKAVDAQDGKGIFDVAQAVIIISRPMRLKTLRPMPTNLLRPPVPVWKVGLSVMQRLLTAVKAFALLLRQPSKWQPILVGHFQPGSKSINRSPRAWCFNAKALFYPLEVKARF